MYYFLILSAKYFPIFVDIESEVVGSHISPLLASLDRSRQLAINSAINIYKRVQSKAHNSPPSHHCKYNKVFILLYCSGASRRCHNQLTVTLYYIKHGVLMVWCCWNQNTPRANSIRGYLVLKIKCIL